MVTSWKSGATRWAAAVVQRMMYGTPALIFVCGSLNCPLFTSSFCCSNLIKCRSSFVQFFVRTRTKLTDFFGINSAKRRIVTLFNACTPFINEKRILPDQRYQAIEKGDSLQICKITRRKLLIWRIHSKYRKYNFFISIFIYIFAITMGYQLNEKQIEINNLNENRFWVGVQWKL